MNQSDDSHVPQWNVGAIYIASSELKSLLGQPSYLENDPRSTAGGTEEHWTIYYSTLVTFFLRHRIPYDILDVCISAQRIPKDFRDIIAKLIPGTTLQEVDRPFDEMRHPDDPDYLYDFNLDD